MFQSFEFTFMSLIIKSLGANSKFVCKEISLFAFIVSRGFFAVILKLDNVDVIFIEFVCSNFAFKIPCV